MRALIIGPDERAAIAKVVAYAMEPEHFYFVGGPVPGNDPNYVVFVPDGFRCVFTHTKHAGKLFRHLTVSVSQRESQLKFPSPEAVILLAKEFGFTITNPANGFNLIERMERDRWLVSQGHDGENCIVAIQPIEESAST